MASPPPISPLPEASPPAFASQAPAIPAAPAPRVENTPPRRYEETITRLFKRVVYSPLIWTSLLFIRLFAVSWLGLEIFYLPCLLGFLFFKYHHRLFYEVTLTALIARHLFSKERYPWWNRVNDQLVLGALPLQNYQHGEKLTEERVKVVVSCVESFERTTDTFLAEPIRESFWREKDIEVVHVPLADCGAFNVQTLDQKVAQVMQKVSGLNRDNNEKLLIYCKAGQGRSAMLMIALLMKTENIGFNEAHTRVKRGRDQVRLNAKQRRALLNYEGHLRDAT